MKKPDKLLGTLAPNPDYHFWIDGSGFGGGPKGLDAVTAHYRRLYEENRHVLEFDIERNVRSRQRLARRIDLRLQSA